jgi:hypothetical protein
MRFRGTRSSAEQRKSFINLSKSSSFQLLSLYCRIQFKYLSLELLFVIIYENQNPTDSIAININTTFPLISL